MSLSTSASRSASRGASLLQCMGNTPVVEVESPDGTSCARVHLKMEEFNPGGSTKSRVALQMIEDAEASGRLRPGATLLEPTGGNTGIGLAIAAAVKGYHLTLVMPDTFSRQKMATLKALGADLVLSDHRGLGNSSHLIVAREMLRRDASLVCLDQFTNPSNPRAHYLGTGAEFVRQLPRMDYFVAGIGSGGTLSGVAQRLRDSRSRAKIVGVQPEGCDVLKGRFVPHPVQGISVGVVSAFIQPSDVHEMISVSPREAEETRAYLARSHGLFVGRSSGANVAAAFAIARRHRRGTIVATIAPDGGRSYLEPDGEGPAPAPRIVGDEPARRAAGTSTSQTGERS